MCHEFDAHDWARESEEEESENEADEPSFLNEEPAKDVELLTDGGDDDE